MKIAGHTMGTPEYDLDSALGLFSELGFDGIEIIWDDTYQCALPKAAPLKRIKELKRKTQELGMEVACLTPYMTEINSLDEDVLRKDIDDFSRCIEVAKELGCPCIRVYGGRYEEEKDVSLRDPKEKRLILSLSEMAEKASKSEVTLVVETHFNTMTYNATETARIIKKINHPYVKVLYDQPNLAFIGAEKHDEALSFLEDLIGMVHVKDLVFRHGVKRIFKAASVTHDNESERIIWSRIPGEGIMKWPEIIQKLKNLGFDGYLSLEYDRRWHPDELPPAEEGMKKGLNYIRALVSKNTRGE